MKVTMSCNILRIVFTLLILILFYSCKSNKKIEPSEPTEFGMLYDDTDYLKKYVYVDRNQCLHISKECYVLDSVYQVKFIDTTDLRRGSFIDYCSECVNELRYERIEDMIKAYIYQPNKSITKRYRVMKRDLDSFLEEHPDAIFIGEDKDE